VTDEFPDGGESMMVQGRDGTWRLTGAALDEHDDGTFTLRVAGGPWTRHGQPVPGISPPGVGPEAIDCGGVTHCSTCRRDATRIRDAHRNQGPVPGETVRVGEAPTAARLLADGRIRAELLAELRRLGYTITAP
jgi:hypothetical protein